MQRCITVTVYSTFLRNMILPGARLGRGCRGVGGEGVEVSDISESSGMQKSDGTPARAGKTQRLSKKTGLAPKFLRDSAWLY